MAETRRQVRMVEIGYTCDKCRLGLMVPKGKVVPSLPLQYPHECTNCGHRQLFFKSYPYITYELTDTS